MHLLISSPPSPTATSSWCPQCAAVMSIRLVEPDLKDPLKASHVFECQECGVSRAYLMIVPTREECGLHRPSHVPFQRVSNAAG